MTPPPAADADAPAWPAARHGWHAVAIVSVAYVLSYVDRVVISLLVTPIKTDLGLSDTRFAALQSIAFGIFYTLLALPLGRLADRASRRAVIAGGVAVFSLFSLLSGFARSYWTLFAARVGVGAGEASITPAAYSLVADYFPPHRLGRAMGVLSMSAYVGIGLAYIAGATVIAALAELPPAAWPWLDGFAAWQLVFVAVSLPGLLLLPLLFTVREPQRRHASRTGPPPVARVVAELWQRRRVFAWLFAGFSLVALSGYAALAWVPAMFMRCHGWTAAEVGLGYGSVFALAGGAGAFTGGWLCDRATARGLVDAPLRVAAWGFVASGLFGGLAPLLADARLALLMLAPAIFCSTLPYPLAGTAIQLIVPGNLRGQATALYLTVVNLVGLGLGPLIVGLFTDHVFVHESDVRYSLALVVAACAPLAFLLLRAGCAPYRALRLSPAAGFPPPAP